MKWFWVFLFSFRFLFSVDYDCIFLGTSPIPLLEAYYQSLTGKKVLVLERDSVLGGAWRSIDICGIENVDLGCHLVTRNGALIDFLENDLGCEFLYFENELEKNSKKNNSFIYFSKGCFELIEKIQQKVNTTNIEILLDQPLESVFIDLEKDCVFVRSKNQIFSTKKVFYTSTTSFEIENLKKEQQKPRLPLKCAHLYLLIEDLEPPRFFYQRFSGKGGSRMMNLTQILDLAPLNQQMIVIQVYSEDALDQANEYITFLKENRFISLEATLLEADIYSYEGSMPLSLPLKPEWKKYFQQIRTTSFNSMGVHLKRWKAVFL